MNETEKIERIAFALWRALRLTPCRCTEPKYWQNIPPHQCPRCTALAVYADARPDRVADLFVP